MEIAVGILLVLVLALLLFIANIIGKLGSEREIGYSTPFWISLLFTPLIGILIVIASRPLTVVDKEVISVKNIERVPLLSRFRSSLKITTGVLVLSIIAFIISAILILALGESSSGFIMYNPFVNGFMHSSFGHLGSNMLNVFLLCLADINAIYTLKRFYWTAVILSAVYLPLALLGIASPVVGISGVVYFLASRFFITNSATAAWIRWVGYILYGLVILGEISMLGNSDNVAHLFHLFGAALGAVTVLPINRCIPNKINKIIN